LIKQDQIEEWIHEVEERPSSGPLIVRFVSNRLRDLTNRNEELLAENIALRTGQRAEEYESRIANLEYQLELLKRQVGSEGLASITSSISVETMVGIAYTIHGYVFRLSFSLTELTSGTKLPHRLPRVDEGEPAPRLFATTPKEELLFVFDSGRTVTLPVDQIEECGQDAADWKTATLIEPRGGEELAAVLPVARMTLFDTCAQTSRRGYARKLLRTTFETHIAKNFIGTGVKQKPDRTGGLVLCGKDDQLVMVSQEGFLVGMDVNGLPFTAE
jgi:DNA gyrase/topoisomerase IV subunit A